MPSNQRASQFMPFDGWKGFREMIHEKERVVVKRKEFMEDSLEDLDRKLNEIEIGDMIAVIYYDGKDYVRVEGILSKMDKAVTKSLMIVKERIYFKDIAEIEK